MSASTLTVGVLGGMGPAATVDFMDKLLKATGAEREQDNVRVLVDCNPHVPDRNAALAVTGAVAGVHPAPVLAEMARGLERSGADFVVMACNTAHAYEAEIRAALTVPFVSLIAETAATLRTTLPAAHRVGLLAADGCLGAGLYQTAFTSHGVESVLLAPEAQARLMNLIYAIKRGDRTDAARAEMRALADTLIVNGAQAVVAACTEVPLVLTHGDIAAPLLDSTEVLVARTLAYAQRREPLPA